MHASMAVGWLGKAKTRQYLAMCMVRTLISLFVEKMIYDFWNVQFETQFEAVMKV